MDDTYRGRNSWIAVISIERLLYNCTPNKLLSAKSRPPKPNKKTDSLKTKTVSKTCYLRNNRYIKYGAPISATTIPAGMPSGETRFLPMVSAINSNQPPNNIATGINS